MTRRNVLIAIAVTALAAFAIWKLIPESPSPDLSPGSAGRAHHPDRTPGGDLGEPGQPPAEATPATGEPAADSPTAEEEVPQPLLVGRVVGEGAGIPGAKVLLYPVAEVERTILRLEGLVPSGSALPDIPRLLATVSAEIRAFRERAIVATTDEQGEFALTDAPAGGHYVLTTASGWLFAFGDVVSLAPERTEELTVNLTRGARIAGRVVDDAGTGRAGLEVFAEIHPDGQPGLGRIVRRALGYVDGSFLRGPFTTRTAPDGTFELDSLLPGTYDLVARDARGVEGVAPRIETGATDAVIHLGAGGAIAGEVVDERGIPVEGLLLRLERSEDVVSLPMMMAGFSGVATLLNRYIADPPREVRTDPDGSFRFSPLGRGGYHMTLEQPGFKSLTRDCTVDWGETTDLGRIEADRGNRVTGVVRAANGAPVGGARVTAVAANAGMFAMGSMMTDFFTGRLTVETRGDGSFEIAGLGRGPVQLFATHPAHGAGEAKAEGPDPEPVEIVLDEATTLSGRVVRIADGEPVPGARVELRGVRARTDREGRFTLQGISTGPVRNFSLGMGMARVSTPGDGAQMGQLSVRARGYATDSQELRLDALPAEVVVELAELPALHARVVDPDGEPVAGALLRLTPAFPEGFRSAGIIDPSLIFFAVTVTDLEGEATLKDYFAPDGEDLQLVADHLQWSRGTSDPFALADVGDGSQFEIQLQAGCTVRGIVTARGAPVPGASVLLSAVRELGEGVGQELRVMRMLGIPRGGDRTTTDAGGRFEYTRVLPGDYELRAEMPGYTEGEKREVSLAAGDSADVELVLDPGGTIAGTVVDPHGAAIPGARVRLIRESDGDEFRQVQRILGGAFKSARSDASGAFEITGLPAETFVLIADCEGYAPAERPDVRPDAPLAPVQLWPGGDLRGVVLDANTRRPVSDFAVRVHREEEDSPFWMQGGQAIDDRDGVFQRTGLEPGLYDVEIQAAGYVTLSAQVQIESGGLTEESFRLERGARILGRITSSRDGQPIAGARVTIAPVVEESADADEATRRALRRQLRSYWASERSDSDGTFVVEGVNAGRVRLQVDHEEFVPAHRDDLEVTTGEDLEVSFELDPGIHLGGVVRTASGAVAPNRFIFVQGDSDETRGVSKTAGSDEQGRFTVSGLRPGRYKVLAVGRGSEAADPLVVDLQRSRDDLTVVTAVE